MADKDDKANIVHYGSNRCRRVARCLIDEEIHELAVAAFDFACVIADMLVETFGKSPTVGALVESWTLLDTVAKDGKIV